MEAHWKLGSNYLTKDGELLWKGNTCSLWCMLAHTELKSNIAGFLCRNLDSISLLLLELKLSKSLDQIENKD